MLKVEEVRTIKVICEMTPDEWDGRAGSVADTTRWHKAKLLNQRVSKIAPTLDPIQFYQNMARFAHEQGFGDIDVVIRVTEEIYNITLEFPSEAVA